VKGQFFGALTMKIQSNNLQAPAHTASKAKPIQARESAAAAEISGSSIPATDTSPEQAKSAGQGPKVLPPGLERVLERLQATALAKPNAGQNTALASITRNIARYQAMQSIGDPPATPTPATPAEPAAPAVEALTPDSTEEVSEAPAPSTATEVAQQPQADNETATGETAT
jgi:hypothetical protein